MRLLYLPSKLKYGKVKKGGDTEIGQTELRSKSVMHVIADPELRLKNNLLPVA